MSEKQIQDSGFADGRSERSEASPGSEQIEPACAEHKRRNSVSEKQIQDADLPSFAAEQDKFRRSVQNGFTKKHQVSQNKQISVYSERDGWSEQSEGQIERPS